MKGSKVIAIILARGGSKGIPRKNVLDFAGHPLVAWTVIQAKLAKEVDEVYISSDSDEILNIAKEYGAKVIKRPEEISGDSAKSEDAIIHALSILGEDQEMIVMLEPTAPLRKLNDLDNCIKMFRNEGWDSCFSGALLQDFLLWKKDINGDLVSINYDYKNQGPRQEREPDFVENGAIFIFKPEIMINEKNRFGGKIGLFPNHFWQSFEIDDSEDWEFVELIFTKYLLNNDYSNLIESN
jgi:CMP-N,N'-diacetyllegionaminic acid synthase